MPSSALSFIANIVILLLSAAEDSRAVRPSSILVVYLLVSLVFDTVQVRTLYLRHDRSAILGLFTANIGIKAVLLILENQSKLRYLKPRYNRQSPETTSSVFNRSFFWWINPILATGFRKILTLDELFQTDPSLLSEPLRDRMQASWDKCESSFFKLNTKLINCSRSYFGEISLTLFYPIVLEMVFSFDFLSTIMSHRIQLLSAISHQLRNSLCIRVRSYPGKEQRVRVDSRSRSDLSGHSSKRLESLFTNRAFG